MNPQSDALDRAVQDGVITPAQAQQLSDYLPSLPGSDAQFPASHDDQTAKFNFTNLLYYFGGLLAISSMSIFMGTCWALFGGLGVLLLSLVYGFAGLTLLQVFRARDLPIPAGIMAAFVLTLVPLAIFGAQSWLGFWPEGSQYQDFHRFIRWHWLYMELGTLAAGALMIWRYRYPFIMMPIAVTLWYLSMDITALIIGSARIDWELADTVSLCTGLITLFIALWIDLRTRSSQDYAFWLYLAGSLAFWGGFGSLVWDMDLGKLLFGVAGLLSMGLGALLVRRTLVVFGSIAAASYVSYLAFEVFASMWLFPMVLTGLGVLIIYVGIWWSKNSARLTDQLQRRLTPELRELLKNRQSSVD